MQVTLEGTKEATMCYLGYIHKFKLFPLQSLSLALFRQPSLIAAFISYVLARGVSRGWVARLISNCKKVCSFLHSQQPWAQQQDMEAWLTRLDQQVPTLIPKQPAQELPPAPKVWDWVDLLVKFSLQCYKEDIQRWVVNGHLTCHAEPATSLCASYHHHCNGTHSGLLLI